MFLAPPADARHLFHVDILLLFARWHCTGCFWVVKSFMLAFFVLNVDCTFQDSFIGLSLLWWILLLLCIASIAQAGEILLRICFKCFLILRGSRVVFLFKIALSKPKWIHSLWIMSPFCLLVSLFILAQSPVCPRSLRINLHFLPSC